MMENYKNIQNSPNSPLTPLTPLSENKNFNFKFGGDKSLDAYMRDALVPVNNPEESRKECFGKLKHRSAQSHNIHKKPLQNSNVHNLDSNCASFSFQSEEVKVTADQFNKSLSPRLAKLLHQRGLIEFNSLFEREEIDIWVFSHLERKDLINLGIKSESHIHMVMSAINYAKKIYGRSSRTIL